MLLIIVIVAFILTIVLIECSHLFFNTENDIKETVKDIIIENIENDDILETLKQTTGKVFNKKIIKEDSIKLKVTKLVFFEDYDIFLNGNEKLKKNLIYNFNGLINLDIIKYNDEDINIYTA